ncbi:MAG TPA: DUF4064 domain-containing protein [Vagococcus sp.]|nr:DUF4064 domain-containing protein [Vagococcus sp.]
MKEMNVRKTESVLTLISGIVGVIVSGFTLLIGVLFTAVDFSTLPELEATTDELEILGIMGGGIAVIAAIALIISIALIIISTQLKKNKNTVVYGVIILILAIIPFFLLTFLWTISGILGVIAGIMMLSRKVEMPEDPMAF